MMTVGKFTPLTWPWFPLIDEQVGRIFEALEETGRPENTLVIFMSDHGEMLGDHGIYFKGPHFYDCQMLCLWFFAGRRAESNRGVGSAA